MSCLSTCCRAATGRVQLRNKCRYSAALRPWRPVHRATQRQYWPICRSYIDYCSKRKRQLPLYKQRHLPLSKLPQQRTPTTVLVLYPGFVCAFCMYILYVYCVCTCCVHMLYVYSVCLFRMFFLYVYFACVFCICILHVYRIQVLQPGASRDSLGTSRDSLGASKDFLGASRNSLGASTGFLGASRDFLGDSMDFR